MQLDDAVDAIKECGVQQIRQAALAADPAQLTRQVRGRSCAPPSAC